MITYFAQTSPVTDLGSYFQNIFQQAIGIDIMLAFRLLGLWLFIVWLVFALWVAIDASARYKQWQVAVLWFLFVLPFNLVGFIGYLFMRPAVTIDEHQWTKLESKYLMHELSSVNDCPTCGTLVPVHHNFCPVCGTQMNVQCPKCEAMQSIYHLHCTGCGETLGEVQKETKLKVTAHKVNLLHKLGDAVLRARDSVKNKAKKLKEKVVFKKKEKEEKVSKDSKETSEVKSTEKDSK